MNKLGYERLLADEDTHIGSPGWMNAAKIWRANLTWIVMPVVALMKPRKMAMIPLRTAHEIRIHEKIERK